MEQQEGLKSVKGMLHQNHKEKRKVMTDINHLKRLCIDHYFQDEINDGMDACLNLVHSDDLLDATLSFRLLREAGYDISADEVLRKFVNETDDFSLDHTKDIRGLLSLQDISHLNMGEASLYKANDFSRKHLTSAIKHLDLNLARYVRHSLDHPYHVSLTQYKARHHLSYLQSLSTRNTAMEELALADFQLNKLQHQMEMQEVKRWDLAAAASLPSYMRSCYSALYTITNDIADMAEREHGLNPIDHLKKDWAMLFDAFLLEAKWLSANQVPSLDDYLSNGVITTGGPLALVHLFSMLGHDPTRDATNLTAGGIPPIISCPSKILRLWDDMGSAKDEAQDGLDGSYKELYLKENPGGDAEGHMLALIDREWEELNRECFSRRAFPPSMTRISLNLARMVRVLFGYGEGQTLPVLEEYIRMLLL